MTCSSAFTRFHEQQHIWALSHIPRIKVYYTSLVNSLLILNWHFRLPVSEGKKKINHSLTTNLFLKTDFHLITCVPITWLAWWKLNLFIYLIYLFFTLWTSFDVECCTQSSMGALPTPWHASEWSRSAVSDSGTPWAAAPQAPPSVGFSRQEHWSGVPFLSPGNCI